MGMAFSLSDAISIEKIISPQIAITSRSDNYLLFSRLRNKHFKWGLRFLEKHLGEGNKFSYHWFEGTLFTKLHFVCNLQMDPISYARDKHSDLLGPFQ
jgi:hypothetical protein